MDKCDVYSICLAWVTVYDSLSMSLYLSLSVYLGKWPATIFPRISALYINAMDTHITHTETETYRQTLKHMQTHTHTKTDTHKSKRTHTPGAYSP